MIYEITSIDSRQSAKVIALTSLILSLIFTVIGLSILIVGLIQEAPLIISYSWIYIFMPLVYFVVIYVFSRIFFWIYNKVAQKTGGFRLELEDIEEIR